MKGYSDRYTILYGLVSDPDTTQVLVTFENGQTESATVAPGLWYLIGLETAGTYQVTRVVGYDQEGNELARYEVEWE